jgi:hypothetical protein
MFTVSAQIRCSQKEKTIKTEKKKICIGNFITTHVDQHGFYAFNCFFIWCSYYVNGHCAAEK